MLMTSKEICTDLKIDRGTLYRWMRTNDFPKTRIGGTWRFELEKIKEWAGKFNAKNHKKMD